MEKLNGFEQKSLVDELNQGRELANELINHIGSIATKEICEQLVEKILSSYDNALAVLSWRGLLQDTSPVLGLLDCPKPFDGLSPKKEAAFAADDSKNQCHRGVFKKSKQLQRWSKEVRICTGTGVGDPLDDGYSWRKYGQKEILGAIYPRAYYRCTHRHTKGCAATKLVQRSDEDPSIFEVTYRGKHRCIETSTSTSNSFEDENVKVNKDDLVQENQKQEMDVLIQFGQGLKVQTEKCDSMEDIFPSFSFQSSPVESENQGNRISWEPLGDDTFLDYSFSPLFTSLEASEPRYALSLCQTINHRTGLKRTSLKSDLIDINSTATSVTEWPIDWDLSIDQEGFDPNFPHDYHF